MLWTGGKDSALALYKAAQCDYHVSCLVTFAPEKPHFLAHSLELMKMQAASLGLPHYVVTIKAPYDESYENNLRRLRDELEIECVVTGDIALVQGSPNWIRERCRPIGMEVFTPLWEKDRESLLRDLIDGEFKVYFTCVNTDWLDGSWVGRCLDEDALRALHIARQQSGIDLCGEEGEYHTMVVDGPQFSQAIALGDYSIETSNSLRYMDIKEMAFKEEAGVSSD